MRSLTTEMKDPREWLDVLESDAEGMMRLILESGDLAVAAFRLARARNAGRRPNPRAITSVARELAARTGYFDVLPSRLSLVQACSQAGLVL